MRLGGLEERSLDRPADALARYRAALAIPGARGSVRPAAREAVERFLDGAGPAAAIPAPTRLAVAEELLPHFERARDPGRVARALEVMRAGGTKHAAPVELDRRLVALYGGDLADPARAWDAGARILAAAPTDAGNRAVLAGLSNQLGRHADLAARLGEALARVQADGAPPAEVRKLAAELARISGEALGDPAAAEQAWLAVLGAQPDDGAAFDALTQLYRGAARWTDLRALLERRAEVTADGRVRKAALVELAQLEEDVLGDPARAAAAHVRILDLDPTGIDSYKALERLYAEAEQWPELEALLTREHDVAPDKDQASLYYRRAELRAHHLGDRSGAVDLLEEVVARYKGHADGRELLEELLPDPDLRLRIARILEPLYEADELWKDLILVLRAQRDGAGTAEAVELSARIAGLEEDRTDSPRAAFDTWIEALVLDPTDERARTALPRLGQLLDRWADVTRAWEQAAASPDAEPTTRAALYAELGEMYDLRLADTERATSAYERMIAADPHSPTTARSGAIALARLYEEEARWDDLRAILRRQADGAESADEREQLLARVARLEEDPIGDTEAAIATWREILAEDPDQMVALEALERLYQAGGRWAELVEILRRRASLAETPEAARDYLRRIAELHEVRLGAAPDAIAARLEILEHVPDDPETLVELSRLYRQAGRHAYLLDVLERRLAAAAGLDERIALEAEIAGLLAGPLARDVEAIDRWARVIQMAPDHAGAIAAVEDAMSIPTSGRARSRSCARSTKGTARTPSSCRWSSGSRPARSTSASGSPPGPRSPSSASTASAIRPARSTPGSRRSRPRSPSPSWPARSPRSSGWPPTSAARAT